MARELKAQLDALTSEEECERGEIVEDWRPGHAPEFNHVVGRFRTGASQDCELVAVWLPVRPRRRILVAVWSHRRPAGRIVVEILAIPLARGRPAAKRAAIELLQRRYPRDGAVEGWEPLPDWTG